MNNILICHTMNGTKFQPAQMNPQKDPLDCHGNFRTSRPGNETIWHGWASTSRSCAVYNKFYEHLYSQVSFLVHLFMIDFFLHFA